MSVINFQQKKNEKKFDLAVFNGWVKEVTLDNKKHYMLTQLGTQQLIWFVQSEFDRQYAEELAKNPQLEQELDKKVYLNVFARALFDLHGRNLVQVLFAMMRS